jgi:hypothetical protein
MISILDMVHNRLGDPAWGHFLPFGRYHGKIGSKVSMVGSPGSLDLHIGKRIRRQRAA